MTHTVYVGVTHVRTHAHAHTHIHIFTQADNTATTAVTAVG